jgi:hypothetical protein
MLTSLKRPTQALGRPRLLRGTAVSVWAEVHKECASLVRKMGEKVARIYYLEISDGPEKKVV